MMGRTVVAFLVLGCSAQPAPPPSAAPEPLPAADSAPPPPVASAPDAPDAGESEAERRTRLARELEAVDRNPSRSVGPDAAGLVQKFIAAVNAHDPGGVIGTSTAECLQGECASLAREARTQFDLRQQGSVTVRDNRATAGADVVCTGGRKCDFVHLLLERRVVTVHDAGVLSQAWAWRVADITESKDETNAWLGATTPEKVPTPSGDVAMGGPVGGAGVANAARVIAGMRAGFRRCYARSLAEDPDASGSVRLEIRIGPDGDVTSATATPTGNMSKNALACIEARARAGVFDRPKGGGATLVVPFTFTPAQ
jgi:hypothetical protein